MTLSLILGWLKLALFAAILAEMTARAGSGLMGVFSTRKYSPLAKFGLGYLMGMGMLGLVLIGLACSNIFHPSVIWLSAAILGSLSLRSDRKGLLTADAVRDAGVSGPGLAILAVGAAALPSMIVPVTNHDSYVYHVGLAWQSLLMHRIPLSNVSATMHFPLPVDMLFSYSLLLKDDRLCKITVYIAFLAASGLFADWCRDRQIRYAGWLGPLLALSSGILLPLTVQAKNDIPAAAFLVAGTLMWMRGNWTIGALMLGFSVAGKEIYSPLVFFLAAMNYGPLRRRSPILALIVLPIVPWYAKNILATGSLFYPFLAGPLDFDQPGELSGRIRESIVWAFSAGRWRTAIGGVGDMVRVNLPLLAALLPALFLLKTMRRILAACVLSIIVTLTIIHISRYWLPALWLMSLISAVAITRVPIRFRVWVAGSFAFLCVGHSLFILKSLSQNWADLRLSKEEFLASNFTTYDEAVRKLEEIRPRRIVSVGERLVYRVPARIVYGGQVRETPLVWRLAKESDGVDRLAIKFRQLGGSHLLYNYISAEWIGPRYGKYPWDRRMIRIYVDYCKKYQEIVWQTHTNNFRAGGFVIYRLRRQPLDPAPKRIWFAPGTEQVYSEMTRLRDRRRYAELFVLSQKVFELMPAVGNAWNKVGYSHYLLKDYKNAYRYLKEFAQEGMLDEFNLASCGISALESGHLMEAEQLLSQALERTPVHRKLVLKHLSRIVKKFR